ncbi:MFS transporter [Staphylospora marina]|uniref:MFS transporter n=1 Tax=Staphylospora marina TaxID=2490858 RepID=UPI0013DE12EC|nr:MFS transporter [Staphylospora marina]
MQGHWSLNRFRLLIAVMGISGVTQGLTIPLLTALLEAQGVSPGWNGLSAAFLYFGILVMTPFCAGIIRRIGYRAAILAGLLAALVPNVLFPLFSGLWLWSFLRFVLGLGDSLLHYASSLWITTNAPEHERGKRISQYGLAYGLGFGIGPLGMNLLPFGQWMPFAVVILILLVALWATWKLDGLSSPAEEEDETESSGKVRIVSVYRLGLVALCPAMLYGFLETALTGNFPVVGLREGMTESRISLLISAFVWGSLLFQVPLGHLGDRFGRKRVLTVICSLGAAGMALIPLWLAQPIPLFLAFVLTGGLLGSIYSLGLAYLADILPGRFLPLANAVASIHFSVGSLLGPVIGGMLIEWMGGESLFYFLSVVLSGFVVLAVAYRVQHRSAEKPNTRKEAC